MFRKEISNKNFSGKMFRKQKYFSKKVQPALTHFTKTKPTSTYFSPLHSFTTPYLPLKQTPPCPHTQVDTSTCLVELTLQL